LKKNIIKSLFKLVLIISFLELYGSKIVHSVSDRFQNHLCAGKLCISKPKGWLPKIVKENNNSYILNLINEKLLFTNIGNQCFKDKSNGILLVKKPNKIIITKENNITIDKSYMSEYNFLSKKYYVMNKKFFAIVVYPKNGIVMMMDKFDKDVVEEIISFP